MANKTSGNKQQAATLVTALMGVLVGAIAIYQSQFGESDFTKVLFYVAIVGTMVSGLVAGLVYRNESRD